MNSIEPTSQAQELWQEQSCAQSDPMRRMDGAWLTGGKFAGLLAVLVFCSFPAVLLGKATFVFRDFGIFSYPVAAYFRECFWKGELPFWNPYNFCGLPFLAQWNTMVLYPGSLIYLLLPLTWSLPFFCLAHLFWGGLGMYLLAHRWTGHRLAAAMAGVIFSFNGLSLNFLMWPSHIATFSWVPWVLWLVPLGWRAGGKQLVLGVFVASMQMLAGGPETILFTWVILLGLVVGECVFEAKKEGADGLKVPSTRLVLRFVATGLLVFLVCAPQLLPFLRLLANSDRNENFGQLGYDWSMPVWGLGNFILPLFREMPNSQGVYFQLEQNWTSSYYAGIGTVLFSALALVMKNTWRMKWVAGLVSTGLLLALGSHLWVFNELKAVVPVIGAIRYPVKFTILVLSGLPLLAAFGFSQATYFQEHLKRKQFIAILTTLLLVLVGLLFMDFLTRPGPGTFPLILKNAAGRGLALLCFGFIAANTGKLAGNRQVIAGYALLAVTWLELFSHAPNQNPTVPTRAFAEEWAKQQLLWKEASSGFPESRIMLAPEAEEVLRLHSLPDAEQDFLTKRLSFFYNLNLLDKVSQTYGFFSLAPKYISDLANLPYVQTNLALPQLLDLMAVSSTTLPGTLNQWSTRPTALPIVTAGQSVMLADDERTLAWILSTNMDFRKFVMLPLKSGHIIASNTVPRVLEANRKGGKWLIHIETTSPTMLTLAESYYPAWKAYVDGSASEIHRANYAFQAVAVPQGTHDITLQYEDREFRYGLLLSFLGCALLLSTGLSVQNGRPR